MCYSLSHIDDLNKKMKVKSIQIKIQGMNPWFKDVESKLKDFNKGEYKEEKKTASFENIKILRKTLTPERIKLMSVIRHKKPKSIYELAKIVNRDRRAVITDINILNNLGFVELEKEHKVRDLVRPIVNFEKLNIGVTI